MRLTRTLTLGAVVAIVVAVGAPAAHATPARKGLLYLGSGSAITAISPETGAVQFTKTPAIATRDWSRLYSTQSMNTETVLTTSDARNGKTLATRRLAPNLGVRAVSDNGQAVVLTEGPTGANPYVPQPRSTTALTVVRVGEKPRTYLVHGNVEPEAFSLSTRSLFVIEYTPPTAPDRYRVARIDLTNQHAAATPHAVRSNEDELSEPMRGTARAQTMAPDGRRLYTLYTRDATATEPAESFVHVLDLQHERATCVDLPPEFASSPVGAVAVSPSGTRLYVVAPAAGALAEIDTAALRITRTAQLPEAVDRYDGASDRRRKHQVVRRHGRRSHLGGPHRPRHIRRVVHTGHHHRHPTGCDVAHPLRLARRSSARGRPGDGHHPARVRSGQLRPDRPRRARRSARSCRKTAPTSSAPAER